MDGGDAALPIAGAGASPKVRPSKRGRWRAAVLIAVHGIIAAHITHFVIAGKTLSPVEPSESMYALELGQINAGFLFFIAALLATLVFGRWFCGWGCHIVALQDLCGWMMKKVGIRPRPFRSRLLLWAPLIAALYMFVWPTVKRLWLMPSPPPFPGFSNHLMTSGFWDTFPGPAMAALTFAVCGFVAVYLLGAKGFCTYACPYGGFFAPLDRLSPGRIRVTDACMHCGHCTAVCTSNVRVHDEVKRFGMVVDPGCMKCTDCISVCPTDALYYGFGKPAVGAADAHPPRARCYPLSVGEELALGLMALLGTLIYDRLYVWEGGLPLLLSICLGSLTAFIGLRCWQLFRSQRVQLQNLTLKSRGAIQPVGWLFAVVATLFLAFTAHAGLINSALAGGRHYLERTSEAERSDVLSGAAAQKSYSAQHTDAVRKAARYFGVVERWAPTGVLDAKLGLAWTALLRGDADEGEQRIREAIAIAPETPRQHQNLVDFLTAQGRFGEAADVMREKLELAPSAADRSRLIELMLRAGRGAEAAQQLEQQAAEQRSPAGYFDLGVLYVQLGQFDDAVRSYRNCLELAPGSAEAHYNLGGLLRRIDRAAEAIPHLTQAAELAATDFDAQVELGLALATVGQADAAIERLEQAITMAPERPESRLHLPRLIEELRSSGRLPIE